MRALLETVSHYCEAVVQPSTLTQASKLGDMLGLLVSFTEDPAQLKEQVSLHTHNTHPAHSLSHTQHTPCTLSLTMSLSLSRTLSLSLSIYQSYLSLSIPVSLVLFTEDPAQLKEQVTHFLHPTTYTPHYTPYTLHPTPHTPHPTACTHSKT
jgi:hypothetical protein